MNRKISFVLLLLTAALIGAQEALALPQYLTAFQQVYTDGSCGTCHVSPAGGGPRNSYGTMFENQPNHATDPVAALKTIGAAPGTSPLATATLTPTATPMSATNFTANMTGNEEVPPVSTPAWGNATFNLSNNGTVLKFRVTVANITNATVSHIHLAPVGVNGSIVVFLYPGPTKVGRFDGVLAEGNITQTNLTGPLVGQPLSALINNMTAGNTYVNIHTTQHPDGEIRGQIQVAPSSNVTPSATPSNLTH